MAKFKKLAMLCTALLATASIATFTACDLSNLFSKPANGSSSEISSVVETPEENVLTGGAQTITTNATGATYVFTAKVNDTYVLTFSDANAKISVSGRPEAIASGYEFTLKSGESISFVMATAEGEASYEVSIDAKVVEPENILGGTVTVNANGAGVEYTFTAKVDNTYVITFTDENAYVMLITETGSELIDSGYEFTLKSGESIAFAMSTNDMAEDTYDVTVDVKEEEPENILGDTVTVNANGAGIEYTFTAKVDNTYVITFTDENAYVMLITETGSELIDSGYQFTLKSGETIAFAMSTNDMAEDTYDVTVAVYEAPANVLGGENGTVTVNANGAGIEYTFTAKVDNTYVITFTDENAYVMLITETGSELIDSGYQFTLKSGETAAFAMSTNDMADDTYDVTVVVYEEESDNGLQLGDNTIEVTDAWNGNSYAFTATEAGSYTFSTTDDNAEFKGPSAFDDADTPWTLDNGEAVPVTAGNPVTITLAAGQTINLTFLTLDWETDTYVINIAAAQAVQEASLSLTAANVLNYTGTNVSYVTEAASTTVENVGISYVQIGCFGNGLQWRTRDGVSGSISNTTAFAGNITKIVLTHNADKSAYDGNAYKLELGNAAGTYDEPLSVSTSYTEKVWTIEVDGDYTFFKLTHANTYTQYWDSIVVYYESAN